MDCDTLPLFNVSTLLQEIPSEYPVAAVLGSSTRWALDQDVLYEHGLTENASYFNTGVLLVNAKKWQDEKISQSSIKLANRVAGRTKLRDQTIMNVTCHHKVKKLDPRFNRVVPPKKEATFEANHDSLLHFIGSPKPWEYLAERLHPSAGSWRQIAQRVGYHFNPPAWPRTYADVETLLRLLKRKFR